MDLLIPGARSLKDKRRVIKSLRQRLRNRYNCSVAETGDQDLHRRSSLSVCVISGESRHANAQLTEIVQFTSNVHGAELVNYGIEML